MLFENLIGLFYPNICQACGNALVKGEEYICLNCLADLPKSNFINKPNNPVSEMFWGRVYLENAVAGYSFKSKSKIQALMHKLKYKNVPEIGFVLGKYLGLELKKDEIISTCNCIVPVPLHEKKMKIRGYNQSLKIAEGVGEIMNIPVVEALVRKKFTETQTKKGRLERWDNVSTKFALKPSVDLANKHVLLIDDVVTTGATLEACASKIKSDKTKVSIATLAYADNL